MGVYTYIPNLIGYFRVLTAVAAVSYALHPGYHVRTMGLYCLSMWLDAVDGVAARAFNQCSKFGALLDMVTDRISTAALLLVLSHIYSAQYFAFALLMMLDVGSHWCQMYSSMLTQRGSHKVSADDKRGNPLLRFYYSFPYALFVVCAGSEGFLCGLYLLNFTSGMFLPSVGLSAVALFTYVCFPFFAFKQVISVVQLLSALAAVAEVDSKSS